MNGSPPPPSPADTTRSGTARPDPTRPDTIRSHPTRSGDDRSDERSSATDATRSREARSEDVRPGERSSEARAARTPLLSIENVSKRFGATEVLRGISLDIARGEIFALLGPSGCGKSTLLRIVSGFETPTEGRILLDGEDITRTPPNRRPINMVFQSYAVFPHMTVAGNIAYGLEMERLPREEIDERVEEALAQVRLEGLGTRRPEHLSGGQRQRVALARALVKRPRLLLLDEPLSALDAKLRDAMRLELVKLQESVGITFVIVTHDQSEAMALADRIAVLESGGLRQTASPAELYRRPVDAFVADFIGTVHAFAVREIGAATDGGARTLEVERLGDVAWPGALPAGCAEGVQGEDGAVLVVRPEHVGVALGEAPADQVRLSGRLGDIAFQGDHSIVEIALGDGDSLSAVTDEASIDTLQGSAAGAPVTAHWPLERMQLLPRDAARR